jgi:hypothetical protein
MPKPIEVKENKIVVNSITFFNAMTNEDLIKVTLAGRLKDLCYALSLDLNSKTQHYEA